MARSSPTRFPDGTAGTGTSSDWPSRRPTNTAGIGSTLVDRRAALDGAMARSASAGQHTRRQRCGADAVPPPRLHRSRRPTARVRTADRVNRRRGLLTLFGLICTSFVALLPTSAEAAESDLLLIAQNFNIAADGFADGDGRAAGQSRQHRHVDGGVRGDGRSTDRQTRRPRADHRRRHVVAPRRHGAHLALVLCQDRCPASTRFSMPLESTEVRPDALSIPRAGLYPVTIEIQRAGRIISTVLTFINRLPAARRGHDQLRALSVAFAIGTHSEVHLDSNGITSLDERVDDRRDDVARRHVGRAGRQHRAGDRSPRAGGAARSATARSDAVQPVGHFAATSSGHRRDRSGRSTHRKPRPPDQASLYTSWLRDGQDQLSGLGLGPSVITQVDDLRRHSDQSPRARRCGAISVPH